MNIFTVWSTLSRPQRNAFLAAFFGWALDAFDYFILVFVVGDVAKQFHTDKTHVLLATTLTLAFRPVGALLFGLAGDRFGRRGPLIINVITYSILELITGFSPTLSAFLCLRALFGIGMGGEWGLGASLALESAPVEARGVLSGILQEGYPVGYLLAALVYWIAYPLVGWRGMFFIGAVPALLSVFILRSVTESPVWLAQSSERKNNADNAKNGRLKSRNIGLFFYLVALMAAFNFISHGTQDNYPNFLQAEHHFHHDTVSLIAIIYNIGAILGGVTVGTISQKIGRKKAIIAASLLGIPIVPLWALSHTAALLCLGAFLMQVMVQGAWGVIPAHLTELAPPNVRGTFIGFAYQCGNLIASVNAPLQTKLAARYFGGEDAGLGISMAVVVGIMLLATAIITALGTERHGRSLGLLFTSP